MANGNAKPGELFSMFNRIWLCVGLNFVFLVVLSEPTNSQCVIPIYREGSSTFVVHFVFLCN